MRKENEREQGKEIVALLQVCRLTQLCLFKTRLDNNLAMLESNMFFLQTNNFLGAWVITFNSIEFRMKNSFTSTLCTVLRVGKLR